MSFSPASLAVGLALALCSGSVFALAALPAFPGAEGWGADTKGGRGGKVLIVTNTNSTGPGSFREALQSKGPRIIVFRVSGVIDLDPSDGGSGQSWYLAAENSDVTVAGQTSPGGVTFVSKAGGSSIIMCYQGNFHDGIWRFLRFRGRDHNMDGFTMNTAHHFIFDHVDFSGGRDETSDATASHHFTFQWCTIANSANGQSYGQLLAYAPTNYITLHHNLYANHVNRGGPHMHWGETPVPEFGMIDYRNNLCYNSQASRFVDIEIIAGGELRWNLVGNYFKAGPLTPTGIEHPVIRLPSETKVYDHDNLWLPRGGTLQTSVLDRNFADPTAVSAAYAMPEVKTDAAKDVPAIVLDRVGAWPRDPMNARTVDQVRNGTGGLAKTDDALIASGPPPPADADMDGMPDFWEKAMDLNPNSAADNILDKDSDGYTNIEEYINDLASSMLGEPVQNPGIPLALKSGVSRPSAYGMSASSGGGRIQLRLRAPGRIPQGRITVSDLRGKPVAEMTATERIAWEPRSFAGKPLPAGQYVFIWRIAGGEAARESIRWSP